MAWQNGLTEAIERLREHTLSWSASQAPPRLDARDREALTYLLDNVDWTFPVDADDRALPEDDAIHAAFPTRSGRHDLYAEAMRLVGAKRSKGGLVKLVNWLLHQRARALSTLPKSEEKP